MQPRVKYPRTFHLPFSPGVSSDDKVIDSYDSFVDKQVVVTEKFDGENCTIYSDYLHARSIDGRYHPSRDWMKQFHSTIKFNIPVGDRICGENLYARHSIAYDALSSYFYGFSYWTQDLCWDWANTVQIFEQLGIVYPTILYHGVFDLEVLQNIANTLDTTKTEGFVVRVCDSFHIQDFNKKVAKWVRSNHVTTEDHWMHSTIIPNKLRFT